MTTPAAPSNADIVLRHHWNTRDTMNASVIPSKSTAIWAAFQRPSRSTLPTLNGNAVVAWVRQPRYCRVMSPSFVDMDGVSP